MTTATCVEARLADQVGVTAYSALVGRALFADCYALDRFQVLGELPLVSRWAEAHPRELLPHGKVLHALLRRAVADVAAYRPEGDARLARVAEFARLRYGERRSVTAIAAEWGIDRSSLHRGVGRTALALVTRRFLQLAEGIQTSSAA